MTCPPRYRPPGRLPPALPGYYITSGAEFGVDAACPHALLERYTANPPPEAQLDHVTAAMAIKIAIEEYDRWAANLCNL